MAIKLIVSDIDNTLIDSRCEISPETTEALERASAQGVKICLATSRSAECSRFLLDKVGNLTHMIMFTGCRMVDMKTGELLSHSVLPKNISDDLADYFASFEDVYVEAAVEGKYVLPTYAISYILRINVFDVYMRRDLLPILIEAGDLKEYFAAQQKPVEKFYAYTKDDDRFRRLLENMPHRDELKIACTTHNGMDIMGADVNKGTALRLLMQRLGLQGSEVMVCGDSENDSDMFLPEVFKVAVGNAFPSLKAKADFVSRSNNEHGVAYAVNRFVLGEG